jgi:dTDP-4-amino-4,6-dideoxygalactose transaminase
VYHLFVARTARRAVLQAHLSAHGIDTLVHYPIPIPRQGALQPQQPAECPQADRACTEVVSLPLHPGLTFDDVDAVVTAVRTSDQE